MKKTVETREAIILVKDNNSVTDIVEDDDGIIVHKNRKAAKEVILELGESGKYDEKTIFQVALLDEKFSIKPAKIKLTKVKE